MPSRVTPLVLKPEIEEVAIEYDSRRNLCGLLEPGSEGHLLFERNSTKMNVRGDENCLGRMYLGHQRTYS